MKIKIMNYKPYEYQLFQDTLNKLSKQGYTTKKISYFTFFQKTNIPVQYVVDFYKSSKHAYKDQKVEEDIYIQSYTKKNWSHLYHKYNMHVFASSQKNLPKKNWDNKTDISTPAFTIVSLGLFLCSLIISSLFLTAIIHADFDSFSTYGITITYYGLLFFFSLTAIRYYLHFHYYLQFKASLKNKKNFSTKKSLHSIFTYLIPLLLTLSVGGFIFDTIDTQSFDIQQHKVITLKDLGIEEQSTLDTKKQSSFSSFQTYISLEETIQNNHLLYIKEHQFSHQKKIDKALSQLLEQPTKFGAETYKEDNYIIYGYRQGQLSSMVIHNNQSIIIIIPSFELTQSQMDTIIQFYQ